MSILTTIAAIIALGLLVYLFYVLLGGENLWWGQLFTMFCLF